MSILSAKDIEDIAKQTKDPIAWRHAANAYMKEGNAVKSLECSNKAIAAQIAMNIGYIKEEK